MELEGQPTVPMHHESKRNLPEVVRRVFRMQPEDQSEYPSDQSLYFRAQFHFRRQSVAQQGMFVGLLRQMRPQDDCASIGKFFIYDDRCPYRVQLVRQKASLAC